MLTPRYIFMALWLIKHRVNLTLILISLFYMITMFVISDIKTVFSILI